MKMKIEMAAPFRFLPENVAISKKRGAARPQTKRFKTLFKWEGIIFLSQIGASGKED
jgi:hypothetical protein